MKSNSKNREKYLLYFFLTKKAFIEIDPVNIAFVDWDEYDIEIKDIAFKLTSKKINYYKIQKIVYSTLVFYFWHKEEFKKSSKQIARHIIKNLKIYKKKFDFNKELKNLKKEYYLEYYEVLPDNLEVIFVE